MVLLKIVHKKSGILGHCGRLYSYDVEGEEMVGNQLSGDDSDDFELVEVNCELGMVEDQLCNIPYELYDLPNLREILSLDTWNSCLTEEERFSLAVYLPDMDQHTFWLTMKELLGGTDLFFGNPVDEFFTRLKGGFYLPKVTCFREGVRFLQRRKYYHSLRFYHENMIEVFEDMRKNHKATEWLDLDTSSKGGCIGKEINPDLLIYHFPKKRKLFERKGGEDGLKVVAPNSSGKGVLKIKTPGRSPCQENIPKGVLKIVPKVRSHLFEQSTPKPRNLVVQDSRISYLAESVSQPNVVNTDGNEVSRTLEEDNFRHDFHEVQYRNSSNSPSRNIEKNTSSEPHSSVSRYNEGNQGMASAQEVITKGEHKSHMASSSQPSVSEKLRDGLVHPITYKRRKAQGKLNSFDSSRQLTEGAHLKS